MVENIFGRLKTAWRRSMKLYRDNKSTIDNAHNLMRDDHTKHVEVDRQTFYKREVRQRTNLYFICVKRGST